MAAKSSGAGSGRAKDAAASAEERRSGHARVRDDPERARLRALFDKAPTFVAVHEGPDHVYVYVNPMVARTVSRPLLGRAMRDAFPELERQGLLARYDEVYRSGEPSIVPEQRIVVEHRSTGERDERWFNHVLQPWFGEDGRIRGLISIAFEVTHPVRSRQALEESEHRFRALVDSAPVMLWMSGPDRLCTYFNRSWLEFTGRTLEQELGQGWIEGMHPDDRERCLASFGTSIAARKPCRIEYRLQAADGEYHWVLDHAMPRFAPEGGFLGYFGSAMDITDRKQAEQALRESEERYRTLLERANDAIFAFTVEDDGKPGRYVEVNDVACQRLGYSRDELLALTPEAIVDTGDIPFGDALDDAMRKLRTSESIVVDRVHVAKDGRRIPVEVSATLLELKGKPTVILIARDVTERRRAEAAIKESEERLRFTLEAARVGTWDWDMTTGRVHWSDNLEVIHNLTPGSFGGDFESVLRDAHPEDRKRVMDTIRRAAEDTGLYQVEYRLSCEGGSERWVEGKGRVIRDAGGRPVRMAGICMDVTERKRSEQVQQLLLHELQHRVKNTLAVVQSLAHQALRTSPSPDAFAQAFQGRLAGLAEAHSLLAKTNWKGADLHDLVTAELAPWEPGQRLQLAGEPVVLPPQAALTVGMVLHELATNAMKHGALSVSTGRLEVSWQLEARPEGRLLTLDWVEVGGPRVRPPARRGFGTHLIERSVRYELDGHTSLEFPAGGVRCRLVFLLPPPPRPFAGAAPDTSGRRAGQGDASA